MFTFPGSPSGRPQEIQALIFQASYLSGQPTMVVFQGELYSTKKIWLGWGGLILFWLANYQPGFKNHRVRGDLSGSRDSDYTFGEYFGFYGGYQPLERVGGPMGWTPIKPSTSNAPFRGQGS